MKKVFYRCVESHVDWWTVGKEYELVNGRVHNEDGDYYLHAIMETMSASGGEVPAGWSAGFTRIERDCFEAQGFEWFRHTPGDPMPCDGEAEIVYLNKRGYVSHPRSASLPEWGRHSAIIGWRFADAETSAPEQAGDGVTVAQNYQPFSERANLGMLDRDISAMDDPSHLTPSQRRHIDAMEEKQAAKERLQRDAESKSLQERADAMEEAGRAMDRVNLNHGHKLGWRQ